MTVGIRAAISEMSGAGAGVKEGVVGGLGGGPSASGPAQGSSLTKRAGELEQRGRGPGLLRLGTERPPGPPCSPPSSEVGGLPRAEEAGSSPTLKFLLSSSSIYNIQACVMS